MKKYPILIFVIPLLVFSLFLFSGCKQQSGIPGNIDPFGPQVNSTDFKRIIILNPSVIKNLLFLGYDFRSLIGIDSFSYSLYHKKLPENINEIGDYNQPDLEKILVLNPDLIIIDQSFSLSTKNELEKFKIPLYTFSTINTYGKMKNDLLKLVDFFQLKKQFQINYPDYFSMKEKELNKFSYSLKGKSFLLVFWYDTNFLCGGKDNFLSSFFEHFGLTNALGENGFPQISMEKLILLNPDIIISASSYIKADIYHSDIFKNINAIKNNRLFLFNYELENQILQPGFDTWKGIIQIFNFLNE